MANRTCRVGVHGRNHELFDELDFEVIRRAKIEVVKMMSHTRPEVFARLKQDNPDLEIITRLHHSDINTGGHPTPEKFADDMIPIMNRLKDYCTKFQVANEPNHVARYEGWGKEDADAQNFNDWFLRVYDRLKTACPWARIGFPGLAVPDAGHNDRGWLEICRPAIERADWLGVHCYWQTPPGQASNNLAEYFGLTFKYYHWKYPTKTLEILECGNSNIQNNLPISEEQIAAEYVEWLQEVFKYDYINSASFFILSSPDSTWSFFAWRQNGRIKPVVDRLAQMARPTLQPVPLAADEAVAAVTVAGAVAGLTNQNIIDAFRQAANKLGLVDNWALMSKAGLNLRQLARDRAAAYPGPAIDQLTQLTEPERQAINAELAALTSISFAPVEVPDFIRLRPELGEVPLAPPPDLQIKLPTGAGSDDKRAARTWNRYGWLLLTLADQFGFDPGAAVAVLAIESGGQGFGPDGRMIIRFENHVFFDRWGKYHPERFQAHFTFDPAKRWQKHQWRSQSNAPWRDFHNQQPGEWAVFEFACTLDDLAARLSISMGAPQIMGFNYATLGYESVGQMFSDFSQNDRAQILGLFDFICGPQANSRRLPALQAREFDNFAALYNGPGQAAQYGSLLRNVFEAFQRLKPAL